MKYDFTSIIDRRGKDAAAVDQIQEMVCKNVQIRDGFSPIPMWVADMNYATAPSVTDAIAERIKHPLFGYFMPSDEYYQAIIDWHRIRKGICDIKPEHIGYENGVLGGVVSALNAVASRGDHILVNAPTYTGFTGILSNNGYRIVHSFLKQDNSGTWRMDFEDMEKKIQENNIHTAIFCSPHNPTGRVWEAWEIENAMQLFKKYDVYVVSDEIWSDILLDGHKHIPTQAVSPDAKMRTIAVYAPTKTFNLGGLIGSYHIIYNDWLRYRVQREGSLSHYNDLNVLSMHALIGAYSSEGHQWVDELCHTLSENIDYACTYISKHFNGVKVSKPEGTYMLFLDCTQWCNNHMKTMDDLLKAGHEVGVIWQDGRKFQGSAHIRMNLALPRAMLEDAFGRLDKFVFNRGDDR